MITYSEAASVLRYDHGTGIIYRIAKTKRLEAPAGSLNSRNGYLYIGIGQRKFLAHRLAWLLGYGEWPLTPLDHINCDKTDNRIHNLRSANHSLNGANRGPQKNHSHLKGAYRNGPGYAAKIRKSGKNIHIGTYRTEREAHEAYMKKARELFGEFARSA